VPAIGWFSSPRQRAEGLSSTPISRRASRRWVRRSPLTKLRPRKQSKRHEQHICFTAAYRIQSGRLVSRISGRDVALLCWRGKAPTHAELWRPKLFLEKNPCRSSARHQRAPSKASSKPPGSGSRPGTEAAYLVHARQAAPAARFCCPSA
jgi:hypothetical protein